MRRSRGFRSKARQKLKGGHFSIAETLQDFKTDQKVLVNINPAIHTGMPHPRFQGAMGKIIEKRGRAYIVEVPVGKTTKKIIARTEHLSEVK